MPAGNAPALAEAIRTLLDNPGLRQAMGDRARARALGEFSWMVCAERLVQHYQRAIAASPQCRGRSLLVGAETDLKAAPC